MVIPDVPNAQQHYSKPSRSSKMSILSIQPSNNNAMILPDAPPDMNKRKTKPSKSSSRKSTVHVQASSGTAIIQTGCSTALPYTSSAQAMVAAILEVDIQTGTMGIEHMLVCPMASRTMLAKCLLGRSVECLERLWRTTARF